MPTETADIPSAERASRADASPTSPNNGAENVDAARPRLPPLSIHAYLRTEATQSARTPRVRLDRSSPAYAPATPASPYSPASASASGTAAASSLNRRRAHSVGVSLRSRSSSRSGGLQGLTSNFGLPDGAAAAAGGRGGVTPTIAEHDGEDARPTQGATTNRAMTITEGGEAAVPTPESRDRGIDVLSMAEMGAAIESTSPSAATQSAHPASVPGEVAGHAANGTFSNYNSNTAATRHRGRTRGSSIVDRIRNSIESRERRDSRDIEGEPVGYEVVRKRGESSASADINVNGQEEEREDLDDGVVGMLDVMDAEVSTVNHLQNVTNSIFLPHFPAFWSRRPEIIIEHEPHANPPHGPSHTSTGARPSSPTEPLLNTAFAASSTISTTNTPGLGNTPAPTQPRTEGQGRTRKTRASTVAGLYAPSPSTPISSSAGPYSPVKGRRPAMPRILSQPSPHPDHDDGSGGLAGDVRARGTAAAARNGGREGVSAIPEEAYGDDAAQVNTVISDTTPDTDKSLRSAAPRPTSSSSNLSAHKEPTPSVHSLDLHVRQVLHASKRERIKKGLKGLWVFLKTPMGVVVGIYGVLVVFWGAALVIILAGWIPMPNKWWQDRWVEICSQIVNGLFTITGVGLIPWRAQDTYRMIIISSLKRRTHIKRRRAGLPPIEDPNDIPDPKEQEDYVSVLTEKEQARLTYQQEKFAQSQTWYRPHATATHTAFPITWALWNTVLMDLNSMFQCMLCGCMWGLNQYERPAWTTGSLIPLSFLCGIGAGVLIWQGSARTKKRETVEDKLRQALGVPLAIALPQTKDGTFITGDNKALIGKSKAMRRRSRSRRRSSQSTGSTHDGGAGTRSIPLSAMSGRHDKGADGMDGETDSEGGDKEGRGLEMVDRSGEKGVQQGQRQGKVDGGVPLSKIVSPTRDRRATVTLGNVPDDMGAKEGEGKRERGQTIGGVEELKGL